MLSTMSVTSSRTPAIEENSCSDVHRLHGGALQRRQQDAAQRVTERLAEAALERFGDDGGKPGRIGARRYLQLVRSNKFLPIFLNRHFVTPSGQ
jgi:hypothetical protein